MVPPRRPCRLSAWPSCMVPLVACLSLHAGLNATGWASSTRAVAQVSGQDRGCTHSCAMACARASSGACLVCGEKCATDCCRWTAALKTRPNSNSFTALYQQSPPRTAAILPRMLLDANSTRFYVIVPPLTHPNADVPHKTSSLGWQQLHATLDSLGRFGYDDVVLIDNGHQQGPLLRQAFARPVLASSGRQYSFSALADALRHAMHVVGPQPQPQQEQARGWETAAWAQKNRASTWCCLGTTCASAGRCADRVAQ